MTQHRVTALSAASLAACLFLTVALVDVPHEATDAELLQWWQEASNRRSGVWSGLAAIGVAVSAGVLRHGLDLIGAGRTAWASFARAMCTAVMCVWLVTGAIRAAVGHLVDVMGQPLPGPDVLRALTAVNYTLLGLSGMAVLGLLVLAVSVGAVGSVEVGAWVGRLGLACAVIVLVATVAQYGAYVTLAPVLWLLYLAVALWRAPVGQREPVMQAR